MRKQPDPKRLAALLQHPGVRIAVDPPVGQMHLSFEEAELLVSCNTGITAWGTKLTMTFWAQKSAGEAIRALRELRKSDVGDG